MSNPTYTVPEPRSSAVLLVRMGSVPTLPPQPVSLVGKGGQRAHWGGRASACSGFYPRGGGWGCLCREGRAEARAHGRVGDSLAQPRTQARMQWRVYIHNAGGCPPTRRARPKITVFSRHKGLIPLGCLTYESLGNSAVISREIVSRKRKKHKCPMQAQEGGSPSRTQGHSGLGPSHQYKVTCAPVVARLEGDVPSCLPVCTENLEKERPVA